MNIYKIHRFLKTIVMIVAFTPSGLTVLAVDTPFSKFGGQINSVQGDVSKPDETDSGKKDRTLASLQQGIDSARKALRNKKCSALFGDMKVEGFESAIDLLDIYADNNLTREGKSDLLGTKFESAGVGAVTNHAASSFRNSAGVMQSASVITINRNGFYFSGRLDDGSDVTLIKGGGFERLDMSKVRGAVIIHELLHAMGRIPNDVPAQLKDGGKQSMANAQLVRKNCFDR